MNWDRIEGQWKQRRGKAVRHWGKMMNDELAGVAGRYEQLVGELQERYGIAREEGRDHIAGFQDVAAQLKKTNRKLMDVLESLTRTMKSNSIRKETPRRKKSSPGKSSRKRMKHPPKEKTK